MFKKWTAAENYVPATDLAGSVAKRSGIIKEAAKDAIANFLEVVEEELAKGNFIGLGKLGVFVIIPRKSGLNEYNGLPEQWTNTVQFKITPRFRKIIHQLPANEEHVNAIKNKG